MEYILVECFNKIVQSAVNALRDGDENPNSSVVPETMKLLANSTYVYQIMDRGRHTVRKFMSDEKHMGLSTQNFSSVWIALMIICIK